jgi:hypothetical protein
MAKHKKNPAYGSASAVASSSEATGDAPESSTREPHGAAFWQGYGASIDDHQQLIAEGHGYIPAVASLRGNVRKLQAAKPDDEYTAGYAAGAETIGQLWKKYGTFEDVDSAARATIPSVTLPAEVFDASLVGTAADDAASDEARESE